jgi:predicted enzyme related to lactoylglutathione lyase
MVANGIAHFDVFGPEPEALHAFYARVFGWEVDVQGGLTFGVVVPDLDAAVAAAEAAGGTVVMPPTDNGWVVKAQVTDPAGNRVSLIAA